MRPIEPNKDGVSGVDDWARWCAEIDWASADPLGSMEIYLGDREAPRARAFGTVVLGGLAAGLLDVIDVFAVSAYQGRSPERALQMVASALLGPGAFQGGSLTAALGVALHFLIAMAAATVYLAASRSLPSLIRRPIVSGTIFGLAVWLVMSSVVVPLSVGAAAGGVPPLPRLVNQLLAHGIGFGLAISLCASRSARRS